MAILTPISQTSNEMKEELETLKPELYLVNYTSGENDESTGVWFWATDRDIKMSPTFKDRYKAMEWLETDYCGR